MTVIEGLGAVPTAWGAEKARWLLNRQRRRARSDDEIVTAFRDGEVTLRERRRTEGFTNAVQEIGYQGIRIGDLVVHSMDGFAGAIGVSDSSGKASPVVHCYTPAEDVDPRYLAHVLRAMARNGYIATLAKGIRERSTAFDAAALADVVLPCPPFQEQRRIADFLDAETERIRAISERYNRIRDLMWERGQCIVDDLVEAGSRRFMPLRYAVRFREGPGIMADDFKDDGVPLIRLAGMRRGSVTLTGCNFLEPALVAVRWKQFRLRLGDYLISGSATMGEVSVVNDERVVGAVPYTGLIILRPASADVDMGYVATVLRSSLFSRQIDELKTGAAMQHFGPTHLSQVRIPMPDIGKQRAIARIGSRSRQDAEVVTDKVDRQLALLAQRQQALVMAAVTGQIDVTTARGVDVS